MIERWSFPFLGQKVYFQSNLLVSGRAQTLMTSSSNNLQVGLQCEVHGLLEEVQTLSTSLEVPKKKMCEDAVCWKESLEEEVVVRKLHSVHTTSRSSPQKSQSIFSLREELPLSSSTEFQMHWLYSNFLFFSDAWDWPTFTMKISQMWVDNWEIYVTYIMHGSYGYIEVILVILKL